MGQSTSEQEVQAENPEVGMLTGCICMMIKHIGVKQQNLGIHVNALDAIGNWKGGSQKGKPNLYCQISSIRGKEKACFRQRVCHK